MPSVSSGHIGESVEPLLGITSDLSGRGQLSGSQPQEQDDIAALIFVAGATKAVPEVAAVSVTKPHWRRPIRRAPPIIAPKPIQIGS
jgi:hypothetical protein